jgi:capsular polysaccharide biosynthesis protein
MIKAAFGQKLKLKKAILFDGSMGINYFHFLSDVLHKMYLLEEYTATDCPVLVGPAVWSKPFFQYFIRETELSKFDWQPIVEPVQAQELWIARPLPYGKDYWLRTKGLFIRQDLILDEIKAIFVNRTGTRHITNFEAIEPILSKHGVSVVDPGSMNISEQAALFNSVTHIIGIHGAGMTNLAFCNHEKVKVLELCSNNRIGTQYYWLCTALGIKWDMMLGGMANSDQSFELNPKEFEARLEELLAS